MSKPTSNHSIFREYKEYIGASLFAIPQAMLVTILTQPLRNTQVMQQTTSRPGGINTFAALQELSLKNSFKGTSAMAMKSALQNALFNPVLLFADRSITKEFSDENPLTSAFVKSSIGTLSKIAFNPVDVMLTRAINENISPKEASRAMLEEFNKQPSFLLKARVGYRGIIPEVVKQVINNGCLFFIKDQIKHAKELCGIENKMDGKLSSFDAMFSGLLIATMKNIITQPADTVAMVFKAGQADTIRGAYDVLEKRAFEANKSLLSVAYRGFIPKTAASALVMTTTVAMLEYFGQEPSRSR